MRPVLTRRLFLLLLLPLLCLISAARVADAAPPAAAAPIHVAVVDDSNGSAHGPTNAMRVLARQADFDCVLVTSDDVAGGILTRDGFDVVVFPGGSGSGQARRLGDRGAKKVRDYVADGGGYIGICAGAYLATCHYRWSLDLINARVIDTAHWDRGIGPVTVLFTPAGRAALAPPGPRAEISYWQGPLLAAGDDPDLPPYEELAIYATEIAKKGAPSGVMIGTTAIARAPYHRGRVFCFSPHPERTEPLHDLLIHAVRWAAGEGPDDREPIQSTGAERP